VCKKKKKEIQTVFEKERSQEETPHKKFKVIVPSHVQAACMNNPQFDFLTNQGLLCEGETPDLSSLLDLVSK